MIAWFRLSRRGARALIAVAAARIGDNVLCNDSRLRTQARRAPRWCRTVCAMLLHVQRTVCSVPRRLGRRVRTLVERAIAHVAELCVLQQHMAVPRARC